MARNDHREGKMIGYQFDTNDWVKGLEAKTYEELSRFVRSCEPFVPDAVKQLRNVKRIGKSGRLG